MVVLPMIILSFSLAEEVGGTQPRPQATSHYPSEQWATERYGKTRDQKHATCLATLL